MTIDNVTIEDSVTGLRFGEPGVDYDGDPEGPTDVTVVDSTFSNNTDYDVEDLSDSVDLDTVSEQNTFDNVVTTDNAIYSTIQPAVDDAEPGDIIEASSGTFDGFEITTRNVTVAGNRTGTIIEGIVYLSAQNSELSNTTVAPPTFDNEVNNRTNQAVLVTATGATVDDNNIDITVSDPTKSFKEGQAVQVFSSDGDPISGVVISDNIITGEGVNGFPGVVGVNDQANTEKTLIVNNNISVTSPGYSFGVVSRASESATSTPSSEVLFNDITATGGELNGVGYGIESSSQAQIDADEQLIKYNKFEEIDSIEHKAASGTLDLTVNNWEDPGDVQFLTRSEIFDSYQNGGQIVYDPVLTEEKSVNNFSELLTETESGDTVATTRDYGSYLQLASNGEPTAVGFSAEPDGNLGEVLPETLVEGTGDQAFAFFVYDNQAQTFVPVNDSYEPEAGEVVVITATGEFSQDFVVPVDAGDGDTTSLDAPAPPSQIQIYEGWNLIATGAANSPENPVVTSEIISGVQIQTQPTQPGAPVAEVQAYDGTWIFVGDDGVLTTGYVEGQPPTLYSELVLTPETDDEDNN